MSGERAKILKMVAEGKISVDEAEQLLDAIAGAGGGRKETGKSDEKDAGESKEKIIRKGLKFFKVQVTPKNERGKAVNISIPLALLKAGVKMSSLLPDDAREKINGKLKDKGINFDLKKDSFEDIKPIIEALAESSIDIDEDDEKVQIYCE